MDLTTALSREGKGTREIAQALGISFDPYDPKSLRSALARTRRLVVVPTHVVYSRDAGVAPPMPPCGRL